MKARMKVGISALMVVLSCACGGGNSPTEPNTPAAPPPTAPPAPVEATFVVTSSDVPKDIANRSTTRSVANVSQVGTILELAVDVDIAHTWRGDLDVKLRHPDGTLADLFIGNIRDSRNDVIGRFTVGNAPALQRLLDKPAAGVWTLLVVDTQPQDKGTLRAWSLNLHIRR